MTSAATKTATGMICSAVAAAFCYEVEVVLDTNHAQTSIQSSVSR